jgi:hypothetical protein
MGALFLINSGSFVIKPTFITRDFLDFLNVLDNIIKANSLDQTEFIYQIFYGTLHNNSRIYYCNTNRFNCLNEI